MANEKEKGKEKDKCVLCGKETEYCKDMNVDFRKHYIRGVGQLCPECFKKENFDEED